MSRTPSNVALNLARQFEGNELTAYRDTGGIWTIGYGHTGDDVYEGLTITQEQSDQFLINDMAAAGNYVNDVVISDINQNQFDALCDFVFNLGPAALSASHLLWHVNQGDFVAASNEFGKWVHGKVNGVEEVLPGLVKRREAEREIFLAEV